MKYAGEEIRTWVIAQLANIQVSGATIPVVNVARKALTAPFIDVMNQTQGNVLTKDSNSAISTVIVQCVTRFDGDYGGDSFADKMASAVSERLTDTSGTTTNFHLDVLGLDANESTMLINQTERVITRQLAYRIIVSQLN